MWVVWEGVVGVGREERRRRWVRFLWVILWWFGEGGGGGEGVAEGVVEEVAEGEGDGAGGRRVRIDQVGFERSA